MQSLLFPALLAVTVFAIVMAITNAFSRDTKKRVSQRLSGEGKPANLPSDVQIVIDDEMTSLGRALSSKTFFQNIQKQLSVTFPKMPLSRFVLIAGMVGVSTFCVVTIVMNSLVVAAAVGAVGAWVPFMMLNIRYAKRNRTINEQLPESLDFLARILRAGHSLSTGLQMMGTELPAPLSTEFQRCYDQHSLGTSMEDCLKEMASRVESTEFSFFVTAVLIQRQTGGDLSTVLNNISSTVRGRIRLAGFVKSKTAEGRFTGYILVFFPILMFFIAYSLNPGYAGKLLHTSTGQKLLTTAVALQITGLYTIKKVTTVKV